MKEFLGMSLYMLVNIVIVLIMMPCLFQCTQQMINKGIKGDFRAQGEVGDIGVKIPLGPIHTGPGVSKDVLGF